MPWCQNLHPIQLGAWQHAGVPITSGMCLSSTYSTLQASQNRKSFERYLFTQIILPLGWVREKIHQAHYFRRCWKSRYSISSRNFLVMTLSFITMGSCWWTNSMSAHSVRIYCWIQASTSGEVGILSPYSQILPVSLLSKQTAVLSDHSTMSFAGVLTSLPAGRDDTIGDLV